MTPEEKRRRRLQELAKKLKADGSSDPDRVRGWGALRWGCRVERVNEYLSVLLLAGLIEMDEVSIEWAS